MHRNRKALLSNIYEMRSYTEQHHFAHCRGHLLGVFQLRKNGNWESETHESDLMHLPGLPTMQWEMVVIISVFVPHHLHTKDGTWFDEETL